ncbi:hypothetical protein FE257_002780 [Aspergillus nanangensis]|uniref:PSP1 C-terminal domain-containing protein n=1 Tax=Aspergillus nanangensis TaxID=2582783 RepID=A0AAD4GNW1_ASPNN|nr:hypothetical protein FE257_002780 [Aspergillus nanangensis]
MAAQSTKAAQAAKPSTASTSNASARLEKSHPGVRRSTPDSDALASSDDDGDHGQLPHTSTAASMAKPARRTSWLNEIPAGLPRKASLTTAGPLSSGVSNPTSPATDQSSWTSNTSPGMSNPIHWPHVGTNSFPWGTAIWNNDSRKDPPPRLAEIVPSPTMSNPSTTSNHFPDELMSPTTRTTSGEAIPFSIPLHPTPKTYRSQSYSVGQLDPEFLTLMASKSGAPHPGGRPRNGGQYSALQHRTSRPSLLGELGHDPATLGRVREDDDDSGSPNGSDGGFSNYATNQARTIEQLARENALLRQAAQMENNFRDRAMSSASAASGYAVGASAGVHNLHRIRGSVPEEVDLAVEDLDEVGDIPGYSNIHSNTRRRFSEHSANLEKQYSNLASLDNRTLENVRKAHWQTTLGFGSVPDIPQSRRHSFADIPIRNPSVSGESQTTGAGIPDRDETYASLGEGPLSNAQGQNREYQRFHMAPRSEEHEMETEYLRARRFAESYFAHDQALRAADGPPTMPTALHQAYAMPSSYNRHQPGLGHPHQNQLLYLVTFKCHRADVFYIQEDTGLQVKQGDLVIVEADRGTDLGTIAHANVTMQKARELKQEYAKEHYNCLMIFSRQGQNGAATAVNSASSFNGGRSAIGGMGPHGPHGVQDSVADIKPKLIKRLAQNHEILTLRDKEGNEAKAKRVCQQKVVEHRLNMEILDAEFQMDWKKLTFYYFADSYINFNSLVTDLFKIYKTRIWMSAINPASFVTPPTAGLQHPNPLGYNQQAQADRAHQQDNTGYNNPRDSIDTAREGLANPIGLLRNAYPDSYQTFGQGSRQPESGLGSLASGDPFSSYSPNSYASLEAGYNDYPASPGASAGPPRMHPGTGDWMNRFQGLSLGS